MGRVVGGGIGMGNTCKSMADSCQVWLKPLQYCKVISLQLIKINGKKKKKKLWSLLIHQVLLLFICSPILSSFFLFFPCEYWGFPCGSAGKESACQIGDLCSIPGLGRAPGEGKRYPLQYSGLENSMDFIIHGISKSVNINPSLEFFSSSWSQLPWQQQI